MSQSEPRLPGDALSRRMSHGPAIADRARLATPPPKSIKSSQIVSNRAPRTAAGKNKITSKLAKTRQSPPTWSAAIYRRFAFTIVAAILLAPSLARADDESLKHLL